MRTIYGNLLEQRGWKVIPTNTFTNKGGAAIMGAGLARYVALKHPTMPLRYGISLKLGQHNMVAHREKLILVPTKHNPWQKSTLDLIMQAVTALSGLRVKEDIYLPALGCGHGHLAYEDVLPILETLDDRFVLVLENK